jgi:hypothetical protein
MRRRVKRVGQRYREKRDAERRGKFADYPDGREGGKDAARVSPPADYLWLGGQERRGELND